ncbi:enterobactin synthetase component F [Salmonella enterica subsp. enterica serovar Typhimurium]|nr:enterobactin synthetase component F [Salmonella enterica subsp. enterica serovar Typhimurium]
MAEKLSDLPSAWSVAHYVELNGELDAALLAKAVAVGMQQADTLRMRFTEENGEVWQWIDPEHTFGEPPIADLRDQPDPHHAALALMQADLRQNLRADSGKPLAFHQLIRIDDTRWYWYQRYHHLLVDGFSFPAITRQIAAIYRAWQSGRSYAGVAFYPLCGCGRGISALSPERGPGSVTAPSGRSSAASCAAGVNVCRAVAGAVGERGYSAYEIERAGGGVSPTGGAHA